MKTIPKFSQCKEISSKRNKIIKQHLHILCPSWQFLSHFCKERPWFYIFLQIPPIIHHKFEKLMVLSLLFQEKFSWFSLILSVKWYSFVQPKHIFLSFHWTDMGYRTALNLFLTIQIFGFTKKRNCALKWLYRTGWYTKGWHLATITLNWMHSWAWRKSLLRNETTRNLKIPWFSLIF